MTEVTGLGRRDGGDIPGEGVGDEGTETGTGPPGLFRG